MKALITFEVDDDLDLDDVYVDYKLYKGDDCIQLESGTPVRKVPQKKDVEYSKNAMPPYGDGDYAVGFNACLDEILGEEQ